MRTFLLWLSCLLMCGLALHVRASKVVRVSLADLQGDGTSVYLRLRKAHETACALGANTQVVYPQGVTIHIAIPPQSSPIPLTSHTNFGGCTFVVENTSVDNLFLFSLDRRADLQDNETVDFDMLAQSARRVDVSGSMIDSGDFSSVPALARGSKLLYVYDKKVWSKRYGRLGIYRRDIIYIRRGKAQNKPIHPYSSTRDLICLYDDVTHDKSPCFENITFSRTPSSTQRTYLLKACGQVGLQIRNIRIYTPEQDARQPSHPAYTGDKCLFIRHSANTLLENVRIDGTYSAAGQHGYGFRLINLYNTQLRNVQGDAPWGVSCGFYLNTATLDACTLNRFDCHCYCADFTYGNCTFRTDASRYSTENCMCQISSAHGHMRFSQCHFIKARPIVIDPSYSGAFTGFELSFQDCVFDVHPRYYYLVEGLKFDNTEASRSLPNLYMRDCTIHVPQEADAGRYYLFHFNNQKNEDLYPTPVNHLSIVSLDNVQVESDGQDIPIWLCNKRLNYHRDVQHKVVNCSCDNIAYPSIP